VEVKIGIQSVPRELVVETKLSPDDVRAALEEAISAETGVLVLDDVKGGTVLVPADKIAYLEFGGTEPRRVGFSSL
jgi:mannose/fructose-specific phosphotransferase system component IIA